MSLIGEDGTRSIRMAYLATVGSHAVNGVAAMHSELVKETILNKEKKLFPHELELIQMRMKMH
jgi:starch phosphorylase